MHAFHNNIHDQCDTSFHLIPYKMLFMDECHESNMLGVVSLSGQLGVADRVMQLAPMGLCVTALTLWEKPGLGPPWWHLLLAGLDGSPPSTLAFVDPILKYLSLPIHCTGNLGIYNSVFVDYNNFQVSEG